MVGEHRQCEAMSSTRAHAPISTFHECLERLS